MLADERGLFLSLPSSMLYKFKDEVTNNVDLSIVCDMPFVDYDVMFKVSIDQYSHHFITGDMESQFVDSVTLYSKIDNNDQHYVCGIYMEYVQKTDCIDIYDAFYCNKSNVYGADIDFSIYKFTYCQLIRMISSKEAKEYNEDIPKDIELIVDQYTNVVMGVVSEDDACFSRYKSIVLSPNDEALVSIKNKYGVEKSTDIVGKYYFINGKFVQITEENASDQFKSILQLQNDIGYIRSIQGTINKTALYNKLFERYEDISSIQKDKKGKTELIDGKMKDIEEFRRNLYEYKKRITMQTLDMYANTHEYKYYASVCLLIKDENEFLEEWLDNYWNIGIQHFYIYDNGSKVPVLDTIKSIQDGFYTDKCDVILFTEYKNHMQYECYENCLMNYGEDSRWIGFLDTDEFVEFTDGTDDVKLFLKEFEKDLAVWIPWDSFNANDHIDKPIGGMRENYTRSIVNPYGLWGKIFVQTAYVKRMYVHCADSIGYYYNVVDQNHNLHFEAYADTLSKMNNGENIFPRVKVNHYMTRSYQDWVDKMQRGSSDPIFKRKFDTFFGYNPELSFLKEDDEIYKKLMTEQGYY